MQALILRADSRSSASLRPFTYLGRDRAFDRLPRLNWITHMTFHVRNNHTQSSAPGVKLRLPCDFLWQSPPLFVFRLSCPHPLGTRAVETGNDSQRPSSHGLSSFWATYYPWHHNQDPTIGVLDMSDPLGDMQAWPSLAKWSSFMLIFEVAWPLRYNAR